MVEIWNKYANTAARKHGKPGREARPKSPTIDIHTHVAVPRVSEIVAPHLNQSANPLVQDSTPESQALMAKQAADIRTRIGTTDERFSVMDEMGVDMQLICPAPPQIYYNLPVDVGVQAARALNDGIAEYVDKHKDRLVALGGVAMQDGNEAAKELERGMKQLGFKGVEILTNVNGKELSDPAFAPFWKKAEELDALVLIHRNEFHPATAVCSVLLQQRHRQPARYHRRASLPAFRWRLRAASKAARPGRARRRLPRCLFRPHRSCLGRPVDSHGNLPQPPTTYLRRNVYLDTVVFTPHQLEALVKTYGADRIVMGTDYPFDMLEYDPIGHINSVDGFDDSTRAALAGGNAKKLLGL